jgi:hypothetical protein
MYTLYVQSVQYIEKCYGVYRTLRSVTECTLHWEVLQSVQYIEKCYGVYRTLRSVTECTATLRSVTECTVHWEVLRSVHYIEKCYGVYSTLRSVTECTVHWEVLRSVPYIEKCYGVYTTLRSVTECTLHWEVLWSGTLHWEVLRSVQYIEKCYGVYSTLRSVFDQCYGADFSCNFETCDHFSVHVRVNMLWNQLVKMMIDFANYLLDDVSNTHPSENEIVSEILQSWNLPTIQIIQFPHLCQPCAEEQP